MKIKTAHIVALAGGTYGAVGRLFDPPLSRQAVRAWGEDVPELRARQLLERMPQAQSLVVDEKTGLSPAEVMAGVIAGACNGR